MWVHAYACMCACVHAGRHVFMQVCVHASMCVYACVHAYMHICMCVYACMRVGMRACVRACMCVVPMKLDIKYLHTQLGIMMVKPTQFLMKKKEVIKLHCFVEATFCLYPRDVHTFNAAQDFTLCFRDCLMEWKFLSASPNPIFSLNCTTSIPLLLKLMGMMN